MTHRRWVQTGWFAAGVVLWALALVVLVALAAWSARPAAPVQTSFEGAQITLTAARAAVWGNTGCTDIAWTIENITGVWLDGEPTVGEAAQTWCLPPPETYRGFYRDPASPDWRVQVASGAVTHLRLPIYALQPLLVRWVVPLVVLGAVLGMVPLWGGRLAVPPALNAPLRFPVRWQTGVAGVAFAVALVAVVAVAVRVRWTPAQVVALAHEDGRLTVTTPPAVLWPECVTVTWTAQNLAALTINGEPFAPADAATQVCPAAGASLIVLDVRAETDGGARFERAVVVPVAGALLWVTALPGVLLGAFLLSPWAAGGACRRWVPAAFCHAGRLHVGLVLLFAGVSALTAYNIARHNPWVAYDGIDHFAYVLALAEGRLPTEAESNQFFAPPLAYVVPALAHRAATLAGLPPCPAFSTNTPTCLLTAKAGQFQNLALAAGTLYLTLLIAGRLAPGRPLVGAWALALLGVTSVWYRSFAMMRGEAWTAFLVALLVHRLLVMVAGERVRPRDLVLYGVGTGLLVLTRQWGVLAALGAALWALGVVVGRRDGGLLRAGVGAYWVALLVGGWFYLLNTVRFGSVTAFNRTQDAAKPLAFFVGMGSGTLFSAPFRSTRLEQIAPIFYSEMWGDFGGYWFVPLLEFSFWTGSPPPEMVAYLGRVNVAGLFPTALLLLGLAYGVNRAFVWLRDGDAPARDAALLALVALASLAGYGWFLATYPAVLGDTIKATYTLHVFPLVALLAGLLLDWLASHASRAHLLAALALAVVLLHNLPVLVTRYTTLTPF